MAIYSDLNFHTPDKTALLLDEKAVYQAIDLLFKTEVGQRFFNPTIGSALRDLLFEDMNPDTEFLLFNQLITAIETWEPRVTVDTSLSTIVANYTTHRYDLNLVLGIKGFSDRRIEYATTLTQRFY